MDVLRRIDKGYALVRKAKRRIDKLLDVPAIHELEEEIGRKREEERGIRLKISEVKDALLEKEKFLSGKEKEINRMLSNLYEREVFDEIQRQDLQRKQQQLVSEKEQVEKEMFHDFAKIDEYTKELYRHKNRVDVLERKLSKRRVNQHEKVVYLEDKIKVMEKKIRKLRKEIDDDLLRRYDARKEETGIVFAKVEQGCCKICGEKISEEVFLVLEENREILECEGCKRILYLDENEEQRGKTQ